MKTPRNLFIIAALALSLLLAACSQPGTEVKGPTPDGFVTIGLGLDSSSFSGQSTDQGFSTLGAPYNLDGSIAVVNVDVTVKDKNGFLVKFNTSGTTPETYTAAPGGSESSVTLTSVPGANTANLVLPASAGDYTFESLGTTGVTGSVIAYDYQSRGVAANDRVTVLLKSVLGSAELKPRLPTNFAMPGSSLDLMLSVRANGHPELRVPLGDFKAEYTSVSGATPTPGGSSNRGIRVDVDASCNTAVIVSGTAEGLVESGGTFTAGTVLFGPLSIECPASMGGDIFVDLTPPTVSLDSYGSSAVVSGEADDDQQIVSVQIFDGPVLVASTDTDEAVGAVALITFNSGTAFTATLASSPAAGSLVAVAADGSGNETSTIDLDLVFVGAGGTGTGSYGAPFGSIQDALDAVNAGGTIIVLNGAYTITEELLINTPNVTIIGQEDGFSTLSAGPDAVILNAKDVPLGNYGIKVTADGVTLQGFTLIGPQINRSAYTGSYGIQAHNSAGITIENVTVQDSYGSQISLNNVTDAVVRNVTVSNSIESDGTNKAGGAGVAITGSQRVLLEGIESSGNTWGGVAIFTGTESGQNTSSVTVRDLASSDEPVPIYTQTHAGNTFSNLTLPGFKYAVRNTAIASKIVGVVNTAGDYTFYFNALADAVAYATSAPLNPVESSTIQLVSEHDASILLNEYQLVSGMSIQAAINAALPGAMIYVANGIYTPDPLQTTNANWGLLINGDEKKGITIRGESRENVKIRANESSAIHGIRVHGADNVTLENFTLFSPTKDTSRGIHAQPLMAGHVKNGPALSGLVISNVTVQDAGDIGVSLTITEGSLLENVSVSNTGSARVGISVKASKDAVLRNINTKGHLFGVKVMTHNGNNYFYKNVHNIIFDGVVSDGDVVPMMTEIHDGREITGLNIGGHYTHTVRNSTPLTGMECSGSGDAYTYYVTSLPKAQGLAFCSPGAPPIIQAL